MKPTAAYTLVSQHTSAIAWAEGPFRGSANGIASSSESNEYPVSAHSGKRTSLASRSAAARIDEMIFVRFVLGSPNTQSICAHAMFVFAINTSPTLAGGSYHLLCGIFHSTRYCEI